MSSASRLVAALVLVIASLTSAGGHLPLVNPIFATLVDQTGGRFSFAQLRGMPIAVTFIATRCYIACPLSNAWFAQLQSRLKLERTKATLLTITLDPEYDTPWIMARTGRALGADPTTWRFATGSVTSINAILAAFRVHAERDEFGIPSIHTTFVYILDREGKVADILPSSSYIVNDVAHVLHDLAGVAHAVMRRSAQ